MLHIKFATFAEILKTVSEHFQNMQKKVTAYHDFDFK